MAFHLVVTQAFGAYVIGDRITRASAVGAVSADHPACVVRVLADAAAQDSDRDELAAPPAPASDADLPAPPA